VRGSLFGTTDVALFEVEPGKLKLWFLSSDRRKIAAALKAQGKEVTEANILHYYKKGKGLIK
jgi:hypothetical protein